MSLLVLHNITKEYRNQNVLNGVSLRVERGERVALIGPNGAGKTTLLRIIGGFETCDSGSISTARGTKVGYLSQNLKDMDPEGRIFRETALYHEEISRLEQKIRRLEAEMSSPERMNNPDAYQQIVREYDKTLQRYESMDGYTIESKIKAMLLGLGLKEETLTLPVEQLSGGEKMRAVFARILLDEPDLLILDEPTNHLDISATEWLESFLKKFSGGVLIVSHDRYFLDQVATRVAELVNGTVTERSGNYTTFAEQKARMTEFAKKEEFRLRQEIRREASIAEKLKGDRKISAWKSRLKSVERLKKELSVNVKEMRQQNHLYHKSGPAIRFDNARHLSAQIAEAANFSKSFGDHILFRNVSFKILGGEKVGIIGPNGCGKTTLINILLGNDSEYGGYARLGEWVRYGYLGQEIDFADESLTVLEELLNAKEMPLEDARNYLAGFQFYGDEIDKRIEVLSGGERVRLYMGCLMLEQPDCLIMDEPTNHLDMAARDALEAALLKFKGTVIAISHDRYFLTRCVNRIFEFSNRTMELYEGNYEDYRRVKSTALETQQEIKKQEASRKTRETVKKEAEPPKPDVREIEKTVADLERRKRELEESFGAETPPEAYVEYDRILREIEQHYQVYIRNSQ